MSTTWQDVRYAIRLLGRAPAFALLAVATLALGVGATTSIYAVVDAVLLRPLPFAAPERLTMVRPSSGSRVSAAYFDRWRRQNRTFDDIAAWHDVRANLTGQGEPLEVPADRVTTNFFGLLGVRPRLGRTFTTDPNLTRTEREAVLSYGLWQRRYGGDPAIVGRTITLDDEVVTVVGVMAERFAIRTTELAESRAELWLPLPLVAGDHTGMGGNLHVVARLRDGASTAQAGADLSAIARRIEEEFPSYSRDWTIGVVPLLDATVSNVRPTLLTLFAATSLLLLIGCANVANLVLGRGVTREAEFATRLALGATRMRVARQLLIENGVLAALGGVAGAALAYWATDLLVAAIPDGIPLPRTREIGVDARVLTFTSLITISAALLFGLAPTFRSTRLELTSSRSRTSAGRSGARIGHGIVVAEVALALVLLVGAGLLVRSFWALSRVDPGFEPQGAVTMRITLSPAKYDTPERIRAFGTTLLERIERLPGVLAVGSANYLPLSRFGSANEFEIVGRPHATDATFFSWVSVVGGRYFDAMGISLRRGRLPTESDTAGTPPVFVIDERLARRHWPDSDPVGSRIEWDLGNGEKLSGEVIGVVGSVHWQSLASTGPASAYWSFSHAPVRDITLVVRNNGDPASLVPAVIERVRELDPNQPIAEIRPLADIVSSDLAQSRFTMMLLTAFGAAALLLTAIGVYGVIAFGARQRTREVGVRLAFGAKRQDILRLFIVRGMVLIGIGLAVGGLVALAGSQLIGSLLYGVTPADPPTFVFAAVFVAAIGTLATFLPARRAARLDPVDALKAE